MNVKKIHDDVMKLSGINVNDIFLPLRIIKEVIGYL